MSRSFNGTSDYLEHGAAVVSTLPITMACWCWLDDVSLAHALMSIGDSAADTKVYLYANLATNWRATSVTVGAVTATANSTTIPAIDKWVHVCGVFENVTLRIIFVNGVGEGQNVTSNTIGTFTATSIGTRYTAGVAGAFMDGIIADAAIWNVRLRDSEIRALASGVSPLIIDPSNLRAYWPLIGRDTPELDRKGRYDLKVTGADPRLSMHMPFQSLQSLQSRRHRALNFVGLLGPGESPPTPGATVFNRQIG